MTYVAAAFLGNPEPKASMHLLPTHKGLPLSAFYCCTDQMAAMPACRNSLAQQIRGAKREMSRTQVGSVPGKKVEGNAAHRRSRGQEDTGGLLLLILPFLMFSDPSPCQPGTQEDWAVFSLESTRALKMAPFQSTDEE